MSKVFKEHLRTGNPWRSLDTDAASWGTASSHAPWRSEFAVSTWAPSRARCIPIFQSNFKGLETKTKMTCAALLNGHALAWAQSQCAVGIFPTPDHVTLELELELAIKHDDMVQLVTEHVSHSYWVGSEKIETQSMWKMALRKPSQYLLHHVRSDSLVNLRYEALGWKAIQTPNQTPTQKWYHVAVQKQGIKKNIKIMLPFK